MKSIFYPVKLFEIKRQKPPRTLVLGGTGKTGRRVVQSLWDGEHSVRIGSRQADPAFDWQDSAGWDKCLDGVTQVYVNFAPDLAMPMARPAITAFTEMAHRKGVRKLVLLSGRGEEEALACEQIVRFSGMDWTIVRSAWFNQNFSEGAFTGMVQDGQIALPVGGTCEPFVDVHDVADVVTAALSEEGHEGKVYETTGPRLLSFEQIVEELSGALGRTISFADIPHEAFLEGIQGMGMPPEMVWLLEYLFATVMDGRNEQIGYGVQEALGRPPRDFRDYARLTALTGVWDAAQAFNLVSV
ncbi:NAD(P)H-binding protein [Ponticaulis sp.]|uniref:NmrA family NAD(P)-binding protein n=1 Tax=Ponticaulis sp. TaxID=2020902 RepID=UPI000B690899|nr:NAD(P)H-binding protein [Ponticaulis sp.]MAI90336.1 NmrA family transcriptional regulator [Ponticaulis sp.]OUX99973.1 MAG: NmrA family transcriptional regulator [Hyphomonadaceae bacterium TMED5]|tara:strand:+ start:309396 stop:310292 length:897 start_codon:yes stop_codon:yes gene_type:complete